MIPLFSVVMIGFFLGMRHATDPDHVVAVAAIVSRERSLRAAAPIGVLWGVGHTLTILIVGIAIIAFGLVIPPRLGLGMEFSVSLMLVGLGAWNLVVLGREARRVTSDGHQHPHPHTPGEIGALDRLAGRSRLFGLVRPLVVGVVHGLAGSAAIALLVLGTIREPRWGFVYLAVFGVGTLAGMFLITTAMALPVVLSAVRFARFHRGIAYASAALSLIFGAFLVYDIGIVHGLFSSAPQWTPQ